MAESVGTIEKWLKFLACLDCKASLRTQRDKLLCEGCSREYPIHLNRPVFIDNPDQVMVMPAGHISNQLTEGVREWLTWLEGTALNLGAGGTKIKFENVLEMEYSIFRNTDVVADAHHLPFADDVFEGVVTFNTFEHLHDPERAANEILRVLKPEGKLFLNTAFLQPLHESPYHFYNTTEFGLRNWLKGFEISRLEVVEEFQPANVLGWLSTCILQSVGATLGLEARQELAKTPLEFWDQAWEFPEQRSHPLWQMIAKLPQEVQKQFAAGFAVEAVKPAKSRAA